jgi:hypothetical protein
MNQGDPVGIPAFFQSIFGLLQRHRLNIKGKNTTGFSHTLTEKESILTRSGGGIDHDIPGVKYRSQKFPGEVGHP